jgi:hypothetical protein
VLSSVSAFGYKDQAVKAVPARRHVVAIGCRMNHEEEFPRGLCRLRLVKWVAVS